MKASVKIKLKHFGAGKMVQVDKKMIKDYFNLYLVNQNQHEHKQDHNHKTNLVREKEIKFSTWTSIRIRKNQQQKQPAKVRTAPPTPRSIDTYDFIRADH